MRRRRRTAPTPSASSSRKSAPQSMTTVVVAELLRRSPPDWPCGSARNTTSCPARVSSVVVARAPGRPAAAGAAAARRAAPRRWSRAVSAPISTSGCASSSRSTSPPAYPLAPATATRTTVMCMTIHACMPLDAGVVGGWHGARHDRLRSATRPHRRVGRFRRAGRLRPRPTCRLPRLGRRRPAVAPRRGAVVLGHDRASDRRPGRRRRARAARVPVPARLRSMRRPALHAHWTRPTRPTRRGPGRPSRPSGSSAARLTRR